MDKNIYFIIAITDTLNHKCRDCSKTTEKEKLNICQEVETNKLVILCDECLKKYTAVYESPEAKVYIINGIEYIEVNCPNCPSKKLKILKELYDKRNKNN